MYLILQSKSKVCLTETGVILFFLLGHVSQKSLSHSFLSVIDSLSSPTLPISEENKTFHISILKGKFC